MINLLFSTDMEILTTHLVLRELYQEQQDLLKEYITAGSLHVSYPEESSEALFFNRSFTSEDISLMTLAFQQKAILLSGERLMIKWCRDHYLEGHGIIWLFQQLIDQSLIPANLAADKLEFLLEENERLPLTICQERILLWRDELY